ncbi:MAG: hypothetical protein IAE99_05770 [Rhodothermales bacterium]|nr:hypothetical protein [Rhodothermales bacterium]
MSTPNYRPIACGFYDQLEALATRAQPVRVVWTDLDGTPNETSARLADLFSDADGEWLRLSDGTTVRLDRLVSVGE